MIFWCIILPIILFFITIHIYKNLIYDFYYYSDIEKGKYKRYNRKLWKLLLLIVITIIPIVNIIFYTSLLIWYIVLVVEGDIKYYPKNRKKGFINKFFSWIIKILNKEL